MNNLRIMRLAAVAVAVLAASVTASAQKYQNGLIDKTVAVVGNEIIMLSDVEEEIKNQQMGGYMSDKSGRCEMLETMMVSKLFLMQARVDSIEVNNDMVERKVSRNSMERVRISSVSSFVRTWKTELWPSRCSKRLQARFQI